MKPIITISRQFGSGGRAIGKRLSEILNIPFYNKEIIEKVAEQTGYTAEFIKENEQKMRGISSYSFTSTILGGGLWNNVDSFETSIFSIESKTIEQIAQEGPCVIVGRCADYVLKGKQECFNVFIYSNMDFRLDRIMNVYNLEGDKKKAEKMIKENDKQRSKHYRYYTDQEWGVSSNYHISIDSSVLGVEKTAQILADIYNQFE